MICDICEEHIKDADREAIVKGGIRAHTSCFKDIVIKAKQADILVKPSDQVPEYPEQVIAKDIGEVLKKNEIGNFEDLHEYEKKLIEKPYSD